MDLAYGDKLKRTFKWSVIQSVNQILIFLSDKGITIDDYNGWVEKENKANRGDELLKLERFCPECKVEVNLNPVNTTRRNKVEGDWSSMWFCDICGWNEMSSLSVALESQKYLVPVNNAEIVDLMGKDNERVRRHVRRRPSARGKTI